MTSLLDDAAQALLGAIGLSVGLAVAAAVFSLLDATLLRPLPLKPGPARSC